MTLDEFKQRVEVIQPRCAVPLTFTMNPRAFACLCRAFGYKAWIESKGKRGHKPPLAWL